MLKRLVVGLLAVSAGAVLDRVAASNLNDTFRSSSLPAGPAIAAAPRRVLLNDAAMANPQLAFEAKLDGVYLNGDKFIFKGANYFGMETDALVPGGLSGGPQSTTIQSVAALLKANTFNSVRLPVAVDAVLNNPVVNKNLVANEPELLTKFNGQSIRYYDVLDYTIDVFARNNLLVMLDAHRLEAKGQIDELWYTTEANKPNFKNAWRILATRYSDTWNVVAADLKNEPHGKATWGSYNAATDWRLAALDFATLIQQIAPRWLIFVEGVQFSSRDDPRYGCFWGENLMDVQRAPLSLPVANRLVYSPHVYGPDVYLQPFFQTSTFPENMPAIWDLHFGFVHNVYGPLVVGEWGGKYRSALDKTWQNRFVAYLKERRLGFFYWCVNPNSGDTEGLLENDWKTPRADKLAMLSGIVGTPVAPAAPTPAPAPDACAALDNAGCDRTFFCTWNALAAKCRRWW